MPHQASGKHPAPAVKVGPSGQGTGSPGSTRGVPCFRLFDKHNALDQKIRNMETHVEPGTHEEIETLKKEKLLLKDQCYVALKKASAS